MCRTNGYGGHVLHITTSKIMLQLQPMISNIVDCSLMNLLHHVSGWLMTPDRFYSLRKTSQNGIRVHVNQRVSTWKSGLRAPMWRVNTWRSFGPVSVSWPFLQPVQNTENGNSSTCQAARLDLKNWFPCLHVMGKHVGQSDTVNTLSNIKSSHMKHFFIELCICQVYSRYILVISHTKNL